MSTRLTVRLDFDDQRRLGPGKVALLEAIKRHGSIAAAGREFGMAYRRAWLLVDDLNHMFAEPLVTAKGGGRAGGGAELTTLGEEVVQGYRAVENKLRLNAASDIKKLERRLATARSATPR